MSTGTREAEANATSPGRSGGLFSRALRAWARDPQRLRRRLQAGGPATVKIGQFFALRPDLIPQEYADELTQLLDDAPTIGWLDVRQVIEEELGDPRMLFSWINPVPVAAGSLAQTHAARLRNGRRVIVKVQRPGTADVIAGSMRRLRVAVRLLRLGRVTVPFDPDRLLDELQRWLEQELNFELESRNQARLYRLAEGSTSVRIPRAYRRLTVRHVLVSEQLMGVPFTEVLDAQASATRSARRWLSHARISTRRLAMNLVYATLQQIFDYRFFHADVHPGNLLALPDGRIGYVDFGLCAPLEPHLGRNQRAYLVAAYRRDVRAMYSALLELLAPSPHTDFAAFRREFSSVTRRMFAELSDPRSQPVRQPPIGRWLLGTMRAARVHGLELSPRLLAMYRALLTAETVAHRLSPGADLRRVGVRFFAERLQPRAADVVARHLAGLVQPWCEPGARRFWAGS